MSRMKELWLRFLRWHGWSDFVRWHGWSDFIHWKGWSAFVKWPGWKKLLFPHPAVVILALTASAAGLSWVFLGGNDQHPAAYGIYVVSFYALVTVAAALPKFLKKADTALHENTLTNKILTDEDLRFRLGLYGEQIINFVYGLFKCVIAVFYASAWTGADGFYNLIQGIIQLVQILRRKNAVTMEQQWKSYRLCGWLVLIMHLSTTGLAFLMIHDHMAEEYPGFMIFATAAFAFYKLISSFIDVARDRKHKAPIDSSVRLMDFSQALFNLFSLQVALLHAFGQDYAFAGIMNTITGSVVSLLMAGMGVYMIRRAGKALKNI